MFTLSVVLGSSILYKDFNSATPARLLKFIFGCISTFIGVYLITSKRHIHHHPKSRPSIPRIRPVETAPLLIVTHSPTESSSSGLGETPPHLIGTSFGYHFTDPKILQRRTSRSTLPRRGKRDDIASAIWSRWRNSEDVPPADTVNRPQTGLRTQSESLPPEEWDGERLGWRRDVVSEDVTAAVRDERGRESLGRERGYSVV
jgi:hypothetical protein